MEEEMAGVARGLSPAIRGAWGTAVGAGQMEEKKKKRKGKKRRKKERKKEKKR